MGDIVVTGRLKVLLLTDDAFVGGGQQHVLSLARRIDPKKFEVAVGCPRSGFLVDEIQRSGIRHFPVDLPERADWVGMTNVREILKSFMPDIVHSHGGTAGFYGRLASFFFPSIRMVHTYHGIHYLNFKGGWRKHLYTLVDRLLLGITDRVICVARSDFQAGLRAGVVTRRKGVVIFNGIDFKKFRGQKRNVRGKASRDKLVGTIGRLHIQKGQEDLLKAARIVLRENPRVSFCIIGEGELGGRLRAVAGALDIASRVSFPGARTDIADQLSRMDVFVLPSLWEGFPIVLLEAMAARKPIVATAVNGVLEILENGKNALLVSPGNPQELSKAILRMLADGNFAASCGANALAKVRSTFTEAEMVRRTEDVYLDLRQRK